MVNENKCNALAITKLLQRDYPAVTSKIQEICIDAGVEINNIGNANDYWCRDFMPVQVTRDKYIQFRYDPTYYQSPKYCHLKTDVALLYFNIPGLIRKSEIILDAGNIVYYDNKAIITDKVFLDNPNYKKENLISHLYSILQLEKLIIIPAIPYELTGHADGMLKFVNADTILINDLRFTTSKSYWQKILISLKLFNIILLPNSFHLNKNTDNATGDYLNIIMVKNIIVAPAYNTTTDRLAHKIIEMAFPTFNLFPILVDDLACKGGGLHCATWNYNI